MTGVKRTMKMKVGRIGGDYNFAGYKWDSQYITISIIPRAFCHGTKLF